MGPTEMAGKLHSYVPAVPGNLQRWVVAVQQPTTNVPLLVLLSRCCTNVTSSIASREEMEIMDSPHEAANDLLKRLS